MPETLQKLRPDRDLQCYFERPSAIAALSEASATGFTVSGCWRQQFDWAVVEWNRDNVFEHPALRNLPDGDLSGITLSYEEERTNCIGFDSTWYPTVDWPSLRVWREDAAGIEHFHKIPLTRYATPAGGEYVGASVEFELGGTATALDYIELAWSSEHWNYRLLGVDTPETAVAALAEIITQNSPTASAVADGNRITLTYRAEAGTNANRIGVYGTVHGTCTEVWSPVSGLFNGGRSPSRWHVELNFGALIDENDVPVPMDRVRKLRWTWVADIQQGSFARSEFAVVVSNWTVGGSNAAYRIAGPGSRRIEDDDAAIGYTGVWTESRGNYSGGSIRHTTAAGAALQCAYRAAGLHTLYLATRRAPEAGEIEVRLDGGPAIVKRLTLPDDAALVRLALAEVGAGEHTVAITNRGASFHFDFLEIAVPTTVLPEAPESPKTTLATDWDTDHSIALAPERSAWLIRKLGFTGRANHYVGALWFYELARPGHRYASAMVTFAGQPEWSGVTQLRLGPTLIEHVGLIGDTAESVALAFALAINAGSTGVWAQASGAVLTIMARAMGEQGNGLAITVETHSQEFSAEVSGPLAGGEDGKWCTDIAATPRINRAARDWSRSFYRALKAYGIDVAAAFSMELQHGDDSLEAGIAQRYPDGAAAWLNTPALQTNFSPQSTEFWKQVYAEMAQVMSEAGAGPYLQFGEVQWWYFPNASGMPFYDAYTTSAFASRYGRPMRSIPSHLSPPASFPEEMAHLPRLIGEFTEAAMAHVRASFPNARFEVLYPPDVNDTPLNRVVNLPADHWTPGALDCFKTENFTYTGNRNLDQARQSIELPMELGFSPSKSSHLVGIGEYTTPWTREHDLAVAEGVESVVLFALDQFCLIGYRVPLSEPAPRAAFLGA